MILEVGVVVLGMPFNRFINKDRKLGYCRGHFQAKHCQREFHWVDCC